MSKSAFIQSIGSYAQKSVFAVATSKQRSFAKLYEDYNSMVRSVIFLTVGDKDLDDLVQEAFIKVWKGLSQFNSRAKLKTWIYRIAINVALDNYRKKVRTSQQVDVDLNNISAIDSSSRNDYKDIVEKGLKHLSLEHRTVVVLYYIEELSISELAKVLSINKNTAKTRLYYARQGLLKFFKRNGVSL